MKQVLDRIETIAEMFPLDAVEITSKGFRQKEFEIPEIEYRAVQTVEAGKETTGHKYEKSGVVIEQKSNQMFTIRDEYAPQRR